MAGWLLFVAVVLALVEAVRSKSFGWLAVSFLAAALLWPHLGGIH